MASGKAYIPVHALRKADIQSILSIALPPIVDDAAKRRYDYHHSRRTMLYYLLAMESTPDNENLMKLIEECKPKLDWMAARKTYADLKQIVEPYQQYYREEKRGAYWELERQSAQKGPRQSKQYISKHRTNGFLPNELKLYWNYNEIEDLAKSDYFNPVTDQDTKAALLASPVTNRINEGRIEFIRSGIENAVFDVPDGKQVIILDFADERMPGGYFLENARTQEEVILYNSDGYRALLDLKYQVMDGGYMLPEYGVAYIKRVRFFKDGSSQGRLTDLIVAACYDLSGMAEGIYKPPSRANNDELRKRTYDKFKAIIASAVANTEGNGGNTYLLLGPIGTGAFANDANMIAQIFFQILHEPLMNSKEAIRHAFDRIWFVSIDDLRIFNEVLSTMEQTTRPQSLPGQQRS